MYLYEYGNVIEGSQWRIVLFYSLFVMWFLLPRFHYVLHFLTGCHCYPSIYLPIYLSICLSVCLPASGSQVESQPLCSAIVVLLSCRTTMHGNICTTELYILYLYTYRSISIHACMCETYDTICILPCFLHGPLHAVMRCVGSFSLLCTV